MLYINEPHEMPCTCQSVCQKPPKRWLITDFGFSTLLYNQSEEYSNDRRGTEGFRAPELLEGVDNERPGRICLGSDIWAIGCILFKLSTTNKRNAFHSDFAVWDYRKTEGIVPQLNASDNHYLNQEIVFNGVKQPIWVVINGILGQCFAKNPMARPSARNLLDDFVNLQYLCRLAIFFPYIDY